VANKITYVEFLGKDGTAQKAFYEKIFDWGTEAVPGFNDYFLVDPESSGMGAAVGQGPEDMANYVAVYIEVDSIDDHLAEITAAGGSTVMPRTVIPDVVTFAMFADPSGNVVGLLEADG
jgi:predicted enzyme related to lactoylglutathione lyase